MVVVTVGVVLLGLVDAATGAAGAAGCLGDLCLPHPPPHICRAQSRERRHY